jgi:hypothetical protein
MATSTIKVKLLKITVQVINAPHDMMRYDNCVPATEADSHKLDRLSDGSRDPEDRTITFKMFDIPGRGPTEARWQSYGCKVIEVKPWLI